MDLCNLIWVVTRFQVQDEIEVETWFDVAGKNGTRRDWIVRDHCTKEIIAKATRQQLVTFYFNRFAIAREEIDHQKIQKLIDATTESFRFGVTPGRNDMDVNQHVNKA
ncbi:Palmitoyl-acyl carrier protein thioesterase, chloroplastic [Glycine soja]